MENGPIKKMAFASDMPENVSPRGKRAPGKSADLSTAQLQRGTADALGHIWVTLSMSGLGTAPC